MACYLKKMPLSNLAQGLMIVSLGYDSLSWIVLR